MLYTRLNDKGDAFEPQRNLIQNRPGLDGGGSVAADQEGNVYVAWHAPKDGKGESGRPVHGHGPAHLKERKGHADHHVHDPHAGHGQAHSKEAHGHGEANRYVWVARSNDDGHTFAPEIAANAKPTGVCACCGMRIFADAGGRVFILYRGATEMRPATP